MEVGGQHHTPAALPRKDPVPILQEAAWAPGPVWTGTVYTGKVKVKVKVKVQFTLEYATKAQRGIRGVALFFL